MASDQLHAPRERLRPETVAFHQAVVSLMEELEAMDWYRQRADDCDDEALKAILVHNMNDEMEHAAMLLEWIRRADSNFAKEIDTFVKRDGSIADAAD